MESIQRNLILFPLYPPSSKFSSIHLSESSCAPPLRAGTPLRPSFKDLSILYNKKVREKNCDCAPTEHMWPTKEGPQSAFSLVSHNGHNLENSTRGLWNQAMPLIQWIFVVISSKEGVNSREGINLVLSNQCHCGITKFNRWGCLITCHVSHNA